MRKKLRVRKLKSCVHAKFCVIDNIFCVVRKSVMQKLLRCFYSHTFAFAERLKELGILQFLLL